jgi:ubiquinone/menaquinone biosynthesis C-methylase UbiE
MRVLDLGCGPGRDLLPWGVGSSDEVTGLDIDGRSLRIAHLNFPGRNFVCGAGESLPFKDQSFDSVISGVALPYMNIPKALAEIHRTLVPGGRMSLSLHLPSFTASELLHHAIPRPIPTLFRLYVMANGLLFHYTGNTVGFFKGRTESFQTQRGMKIALARTGFENIWFSRKAVAAGEAFAVTATKPRLMAVAAAA